MKSLFVASDRDALLARLHALRPEAVRQWGKMDPAQMLAHLSNAMEPGTGDRPMKQAFIGKIIVPFIRKSIFSEKPFGKNSPTDPTFVAAGEKDFAAEKTRLLALIDRFVARGAASAGQHIHPFFGKLSGDEWGQLVHKHIDHHLQQFGV